jgi:hypothetical protein
MRENPKKVASLSHEPPQHERPGKNGTLMAVRLGPMREASFLRFMSTPRKIERRLVLNSVTKAVLSNNQEERHDG